MVRYQCDIQLCTGDIYGCRIWRIGCTDNIVVTGITNVVFTVLAMFVVDRWGRKALTLIGAFGLTVIYAFMGAAYYFTLPGSCC